jgi:cobalt-zinc-cadmium efflux system membrane fusion protein
MMYLRTIGFLCLLLFAACGNNKQAEQATEGVVAKEFLQEVVTAKAELKPLQKEFTLAGKVVADPDRAISYSSLVSGVIVKSYFTLGDRVSKGQTMLDIRSSELSGLQSELTIASRHLQSAESLFKNGMATEREVIEARSTYEKLQSDLALYGENKGNGIFSITAPMSGYVIGKYGNAGSTVSTESEPLFTIADLSTVWVVANIYAGNLQFIREGQTVGITSVAYPKEVFKGKINFISQVFDPEDKALKARIVLPNSELKLKPEMSVIIKVINEAGGEMITVPSEAVIFDNNRYFVVISNTDFTIRQIVPYDQHNGITYISEGLEEGETVVVKNQLLIYNELKGK